MDQQAYVLLEITQLSPEEQATMNENALLDVGEAFVGGDAHIAPLITRQEEFLQPRLPVKGIPCHLVEMSGLVSKIGSAGG